MLFDAINLEPIQDKFGEQYLLAKFYKYKLFLKVCFSV